MNQNTPFLNKQIPNFAVVGAHCRPRPYPNHIFPSPSNSIYLPASSPASRNIADANNWSGHRMIFMWRGEVQFINKKL